MGTYYENLRDKLIASGIPFEEGGWAHLFDTDEEFQLDYEEHYHEPWVGYTEETDYKSYNKRGIVPPGPVPPPDPREQYLTFNIISAGTIYWKAYNSAYTVSIEYKKNDGEWTSITSNTGASAPSISVSAGDILQFRGNNATYATNDTYYNSFSGSRGTKFEAEGNIMSLIDSTNFATATTLASSYTFNHLFYNCTSLTSAENLILPATTLASSCYKNMFDDCPSLTTAPELPATTLAEYCYGGMFSNCTGLTSAPVLPATTLASNCYVGMFHGCRSLATAPELPATTLASDCYYGMFNGCTSLTSAPELPATTLASYCYNAMFLGCTGLTSAPELPATTLANRCYWAMFAGCTSLTTAPVLSAITLATYCYQDMFQGCISLNYIKCLATNISAYNCTNNWVNGVASTGTFVKDSNMTGWTTGNNGIPTNWIVEDYVNFKKIPLTFKIISAGTIYWEANNTAFTKTIEYSKDSGNTWTSITSSTAGTPISVNASDIVQFRGNNATYYSGSSRYNSFRCSTGTKFEVEGNIMSLINSKNFATVATLVSSYTFSYLFRYCRSLTSAENLVLPATTLTDYCYWCMFFGCTSLTTAPSILPATTLAGDCYREMFGGCTSLTTVPELPSTTLAEGCYSQMFHNCSGLTTAPELPATTLASNCYSNMFQGCRSLTTAPELPATTLANGCYEGMFLYCDSLNYIKCLATDISASDCTYNWVGYVASNGTFVKNASMTGWTTGINGIPNGWTVQDA